MPLIRYRLMQNLLAICLALFIICFSVVFVLLFTPLYYLDLHLLGIAGQTHISEPRIIANYNYMIGFLANLFPQAFHLPSLASSAHGRIHFEDVKKIFNFIEWLLLLSGVASLVGIRLKIKKKDYFFLRLAAIYLTLFTVIPLVCFSFDFNDSFIIFHEIVFSNNYWIFDPALDPVINILPEAFFMHAALSVISLIVIGIAALFFSYHILMKKHSRQKN
ncbi:MAG: TIGR01906 family membrane protein [Sporolactobacillus sp.]